MDDGGDERRRAGGDDGGGGDGGGGDGGGGADVRSDAPYAAMEDAEDGGGADDDDAIDALRRFRDRRKLRDEDYAKESLRALGIDLPSSSGSDGMGPAAAAAAAAAEASPRKRRGIRWKHVLCRSLIVLTMVGGIAIVIWDLVYVPRFADGESRLLVYRDSLLGWMREHPVEGLVALVALLTVSAVVFFPLSLLILSSALIYAEAFGFWAGFGLCTLACFLGAALGAIVSFLRSRYMTRDLVRKFSRRYPVVRALDKAFKTKGLRLFLLLRLSPLVPYNALNYIGGITGVSLADYVASLLGLLPGVSFSVFLGSTGKAVSTAVRGGYGLRIVLALACGVAAGLAGIVWLGMHARRELAEIVAEEEAHACDDEGGGDEGGDRVPQALTLSAELVPDGRSEEGGGVLGLELRGLDLARDLTLPPPAPMEDEEDEEWFWVYV